MSKISIVGVEGRGKTTLMAAFGEKYATSKAHGIPREPKDVKTMPDSWRRDCRRYP